MAVVIKYIVVRNGVEKMTFTSKKEADAYDKMLDIADDLYELIESSPVELQEKAIEDLSLFLAQNKDQAISILKGIKPKAPRETAAKKEADEQMKNNPADGNPQAGERKDKKKVKKQDTAVMS